ncbi:hypothetical protein D3C81_187090 [compost metagenome]
MNKKILIVTFLFLLLVGCSQQSSTVKDKQTSKDDRSRSMLMSLTDIYLMDVSIDGEVKEESSQKSADSIKLYLNNYEGPDKSDFLEIVEAIEVGNPKSVKEKYEELGGDASLIKIPEASVPLPTSPVTTDDNSDFPSETEQPSSLVNVVSELNHEEVSQKIKDFAKENWETDYDMQVYTIKKQEDAYQDLLAIKIDDNVKDTVLRESFEKWEYEFDMVLYNYNKQMDAYKEMQALNLDSDEKKDILNAALDKWGAEYDMVIYEYNKQLEALGVLTQ